MLIHAQNCFEEEVLNVCFKNRLPIHFQIILFIQFSVVGDLLTFDIPFADPMNIFNIKPKLFYFTCRTRDILLIRFINWKLFYFSRL